MIYVYVYDTSCNLIGYKTYGTNTGNIDDSVVQPEYVMGKYVGKLPKLGYFFKFLKTTPGYIICILIPFMILIIYQGINCVVLFKKYRKQQMAEINEEKAKIEEERKASADMLKELEELKAQLAKRDAEMSNKMASQAENQPQVEGNKEEEMVEDSIKEDLSNNNLQESVEEISEMKTENSNEIDINNDEYYNSSIRKEIDKAINDYAESINQDAKKEDKTETNN
ncbi:MAG: hypothetical protein IJX17_07270 [Clostridia bacterium]|nr:hypothetical protein [Clostridia bacterium]